MRKFKLVLLALLFIPLAHVSAQITPDSVLNLINAERAKAGLSPVTENAKLIQAAQLKANDMVSQSYFDHVGPDGKDPWSWYAQVGYDWGWAGEILAMGQNTESDVAIVEGWMNSPGHRAIIMDARYTEVGIGVAAGTYQGQQTVFISGEFGVSKTPVSKEVTQVTKPIEVITQPVVTQIATKAVAKVVAKPIETVVKKAEAREMVQPATTTAAEIISTSIPAVDTPPAVKLTLTVRLRMFFEDVFTFVFGKVE